MWPLKNKKVHTLREIKTSRVLKRVEDLRNLSEIVRYEYEDRERADNIRKQADDLWFEHVLTDLVVMRLRRQAAYENIFYDILADYPLVTRIVWTMH